MAHKLTDDDRETFARKEAQREADRARVERGEFSWREMNRANSIATGIAGSATITAIGSWRLK